MDNKLNWQDVELYPTELPNDDEPASRATSVRALSTYLDNMEGAIEYATLLRGFRDTGEIPQYCMLNADGTHSDEPWEDGPTKEEIDWAGIDEFLAEHED